MAPVNQAQQNKTSGTNTDKVLVPTHQPRGTNEKQEKTR